MDLDMQTKLEAQDAKLEAIYQSVEKTRKYFLIVMWVTIAMVVLPVIGLLFAIPALLSSYASLDGLI